MTNTHVLHIGIASYDEIKARTIAIAKGKYKPSKNEPKIWFSSLESLAQVFSSKNKLLLEIIACTKPRTMTELAQVSGRHKSNLSRTLKTLQRYGLINLKRHKNGQLEPKVTFDHLRLDIDLAKIA